MWQIIVIWNELKYLLIMSSTLRSDIPISGRTKISGANSAILPCTQNIRSTREKRIILCTSYERKNILEYEWNWLRWRKFNYHWRSVSWLVKMKKYCWQSKFCWRWWNVDDDDKNFASVRGSFSKSFFFLFSSVLVSKNFTSVVSH